MKKALITFLLTPLILSACSIKEEGQEKIIREVTPIKEVEIFELGKDQALPTFSKSATTHSSEVAYISPQIPGQITEINVEIGQTVRKGDTLITLGESLSTDLIDLQYKTAQQGEILAVKGKNNTIIATELSLDAAEIAVEMAKDAYKSSLKAKKNTQNLALNQLDNSKIELDNAEKAYINARDTYYIARDTLEDTEDGNEDFIDGLEDIFDNLGDINIDLDYDLISNLEDQLNTTLTQSEMQVANAKLAMEIAKNRVKQAEIGVQSIKNTYYSQANQFELGISTSLNQWDLATVQFQSAQAATNLQNIAAESQLLQANSATDSATLNKDQQTIKSPINGKVSSIAALEGNLVAPGQILLKIEDPTRLTIKTSLSEKESKLISIGDKVKIRNGDNSTTGRISSISPTLNEITKKIDIEIEPERQNDQIIAESIVEIDFSPQANQSLFIPLNSVLIDKGQNYVRIVDEENRIQKIPITKGQIIGTYIEIISGLKGDERIVKAGSSFYEDNEKVKIKTSGKVYR
ncbi:MAG: efflux RND transporter periplasmic adaptor subunit [bacterium]|nr:efflux RND transporter periplasmic adaptor subunit [bacterium]